MKRIFAAAIAVAFILVPSAVAADKEEWTDLINGKDLSNWVQRGGEASYDLVDGAIVGSSVPNTGNTFLCTKMTYKNFILEFEFFGHPDLNSGVQVRSESRASYNNGRVHGYQCELEQESQERWWSGGIYGEGQRGWLYPKKGDEAHGKEFGEQGKKAWKRGEWNKIRIECKGDKIDTWLNGEHRAKLVDDKTDEGFIALQVHGVGPNEKPMSIKWRNIRVQVLKD